MTIPIFYTVSDNYTSYAAVSIQSLIDMQVQKTIIL